MTQTNDAVVVDFPLRGDGWLAVTTPAHRVPSHGADMLGETYAYDFIRVARGTGERFHPAGVLRTLVGGVPTRECYAWGARVHAPFDGEVVRVFDGMAERERVHPIGEAVRMIRNGLTFTADRLGAIMGNHVLLRSSARPTELFAGFAHLATGSVVTEGQRVEAGDLIGRVGHTGNSTSPHLHVQLMDSADLLVAHGIPCAFRAYEVERDGEWQRVANGVPGRRDRIRSVNSAG